MQDLTAERAFYDKLFLLKLDNEHIAEGHDELHDWAFAEPPKGYLFDLGCGTGGHAIRLARRGYDIIAVDLRLIGVKAARPGEHPSWTVTSVPQLPAPLRPCAVCK